MAGPAHPPDMAPHGLYGLSSNQQLMTVGRDSCVAVDDYVFFRPIQSEAVLLQFGALLAVRGKEVEFEWSPLGNTR